MCRHAAYISVANVNVPLRQFNICYKCWYYNPKLVTEPIGSLFAMTPHIILGPSEVVMQVFRHFWIGFIFLIQKLHLCVTLPICKGVVWSCVLTGWSKYVTAGVDTIANL